MPHNSFEMAQSTVNERLDFLIKSLNMSARAFSAAIGMPDSNTRNYLNKGTKLNSDYLESISSHFSHVNLSWLITGIGEPFLEGSEEAVNVSVKKNKGQTVGVNNGTVAQNSYTIADCEKERDIYKAERDSLAKEVGLLRDQLAMKDQLIAAKDEMLTLLRGGHNRPN